MELETKIFTNLDCRENRLIIILFITLVSINIVVYLIITFKFLLSLENYQDKTKEDSEKSLNRFSFNNFQWSTYSIISKTKGDNFSSSSAWTSLLKERIFLIMTPGQQIIAQFTLVLHWFESISSLASVYFSIFSNLNSSDHKKDLNTQLNVFISIIKKFCQIMTSFLLIYKIWNIHLHFNQNQQLYQNQNVNIFNRQNKISVKKFQLYILGYFSLITFGLLQQIQSEVLNNNKSEQRPQYSIHNSEMHLPGQIIIFTLVCVWITVKYYTSVLPKKISFNYQINFMLVIQICRLVVSLYLASLKMQLKSKNQYYVDQQSTIACDQSKFPKLVTFIIHYMNLNCELQIVWYCLWNKSDKLDGIVLDRRFSRFYDLQENLETGFNLQLKNLNKDYLQDFHCQYDEIFDLCSQGELGVKQKESMNKIINQQTQIFKNYTQEIKEMFNKEYLESLEQSFYLFENFVTLEHLKKINLVFCSKLQFLQSQQQFSKQQEEVLKRNQAQLKLEENQSRIN